MSCFIVVRNLAHSPMLKLMEVIFRLQEQPVYRSPKCTLAEKYGMGQEKNSSPLIFTTQYIAHKRLSTFNL
jgi:hypothetical protein